MKEVHWRQPFLDRDVPQEPQARPDLRGGTLRGFDQLFQVQSGRTCLFQGLAYGFTMNMSGVSRPPFHGYWPRSSSARASTGEEAVFQPCAIRLRRERAGHAAADEQVLSGCQPRGGAPMGLVKRQDRYWASGVSVGDR